MLRDVRSGRVLVAKPLLSSATAEMAQFIEEVLSLGLPIVGVISDQQASIRLAVDHKLPMVPHQICHVHDVNDVAQPVCAADRHVKQELQKKLRGIRDIARHAVHASTKDAPMVADSGLAMRPLMRADGNYPREPPGVPRYQR